MSKKRDTFPVIIRYPRRKYEDNPANFGKKRIAIGYGEPILVIDDAHFNSSNVYVMTCFTMAESHSYMSVDYYLTETRPPQTDEEKKKADELFQRYYNSCLADEDQALPIRKKR